MDLWDEALVAKSRVEDREAEVDRARSSFHELVRQLNASGASLREIATRMQLSHQRVHQIVEGVACGFCDRKRAECQRMVAGPGVFICDSCTALGLHALAQGWGASDERTRLEVRSDEERCCFCRKKTSRVGPLATRGTMRICGHCLTLATREFDRSETPTLGRRSERRGRRRGIGDLLPRAEQALAEAATFARSMGHEVVADHHLLLGLMAVEDGVAAKVLTRMGLTMAGLRSGVLTITPARSGTIETSVVMSPDTKRMIEVAAHHASQLGSSRVGTEHLLLSLADQSAPVRELLTDLGVDPDLVPATIEGVLSG